MVNPSIMMKGMNERKNNIGMDLHHCIYTSNYNFRFLEFAVFFFPHIPKLSPDDLIYIKFFSTLDTIPG